MAEFNQPCINILEYKDFSSGGKDWTDAFLQAIDCTSARGGGTIFIPSGTYLTRSIQLKSHISLYLDSGAILDFMDDYENYRLVASEYEGPAVTMYMPLIFAEHAEQVAILGSGILNGNGERAWREKAVLPYKRPYLVCFQYCSDVKIEGVTLKNSPLWSIHPLYCNHVNIRGVTIINPPDSPNTDGINPDGCSNVQISDCLIDVGDDCIAIKSGTELTPEKRPCENITITNCNMIHGHGAVVIGSEMSGGVRNVTVSNCVFRDTDRGIRIKTRRRRGGCIEGLSFQNIIMDKVLCPFSFNMYYNCGTNESDRYVWEKVPYPVDEGTPVIRNILISNITVTDASVAAGFMYGLAEQNVENITFSNCSISMDPGGKPGVPDMLKGQEPRKAAGFFIRNARNISFNNVRISNTVGEAIDKDDTAGLVISE
jgi:polygalacturonase